MQNVVLVAISRDEEKRKMAECCSVQLRRARRSWALTPGLGTMIMTGPRAWALAWANEI